MPEMRLTPKLIAESARLAGLNLSLERAAELLPVLEDLLAGDAKIAGLGLGNLPVVGPTWAEAEGE